jgi:uncharacterized membrane protein
VEKMAEKVCECVSEYKARRKQRNGKKKKWTARTAATIVAYARRDGADDIELLKYLFYAFGLGNAPEIMAKVFVIITTGFAVGAMIGILKGFRYLMKGFKLVMDSDLSMIPSSIMDFIVKYILRIEKADLPSYGVFLMWFGALETTLSSLILFLTAIADNMVYGQFIQKVADYNLENPLKLKFTPPAIDFGLWEEDQETVAKTQEMLDVTNQVTGSKFTLSDYLK